MIMSTLQSEVSHLDSTVNLTLVLAVVWVINNEYAKHTVTSLTVAQYALDRQTEYQHYDIITEILIRASNYVGQKSDGSKIKFIIEGKNGYSESKTDKRFENLTDEEILYRSHGVRDKAIWFLDSMEAFDHLEIDLVDKRKNYHRNGDFCIVYTGTGRDRLQNINIIFKRLFILYVTNINVFIMIGSTPYVYTYFPYNPKRCASSKPQLYLSFRTLHAEFEHEFQLDREFFPAKVANLHGCDLVISTWLNPPYMFIEEPKEKGGRYIIRGIEGGILSLLAEKMNFNIKLVMPDRGLVYKNGTASGSLEMVHDGQINLTVGTFMYNKIRADYLLATFSYMSTPLVVVIPRGHMMSPFQRLTKPFKYIIWSCFSTSVLCGILIIFSLKLLGNNEVTRFVFGSNNWMPFTNLWNTLYGGSINVGMPRRNFARYLLAIWLLYTLVLRNAYIGELFIILQDGRAKTNMKTMFEVVNQNYTFFSSPALEDVLKGYLGSAHIEYMEDSLIKKGVVLQKIQSGESKIVLISLGPTVSFFNRQQNQVSKRVFILEESLMTVPITMYMRHHSYLKHYLNEMLMNIMSSGMISKESSLYVDKNLDTVKVDQRPIALSFWLLFGLFTVYFVLLLCCFLIFLLELWSQRSPLTRCVLDFFNF